MPTLHVFVDANGTLLAAAPAPASPVEGSTAPVFAGISPTEPVEGMEAFEVTVDDGEGWESEALQRRVQGVATEQGRSQARRDPQVVAPGASMCSST